MTLTLYRLEGCPFCELVVDKLDDLDLEFDVHLPDEYTEEDGDPAYATVSEVPFKESVNPSAREQAKLNARKESEE